MSNFKKLGIKMKIIMPALIIIFLSLVALYYITSISNKKLIHNNVYNMLESDAATLDAILSQWLEGADAVATAITMLPEVQQAARGRSYEEASLALSKLFNNNIDLGGYPLYANMLYLDKNFTIVAGGIPDGIGLNAMDTPFVENCNQAAKGNTWVSFVTASPVTGLLEVWYSKPVMIDGQFSGMAVVPLHTQGLTRYLNKENHPTQALTFIADGENTIASSTKTEFINTKADDLGYKFSEIQDWEVAFDFKNESNQDFFVYYRNDNWLNWKIVSMIEKDIALNNNNMIIIAAFTILIMIVASLVLFFIISGILRPIFELTLISKEFAKGNVNVNIRQYPEDEIGQLASSFNDVKNSLTHLFSNLENLGDTILEGDINSRVDKSKFSESYLDIAECINSIIDSLVGYLNSISIPIFILDKDYKFKYANKKTIEMLNTNQDILIGQKIYDYFIPSDKNSRESSIEYSIEKGQTNKSIFNCVINSEQFILESVGLPIKNKNGKVAAALLFFIDITADNKAKKLSEKRTEYQNSQVNKLVEELNKFSQGNLDITWKTGQFDQDTEQIGKDFEIVGKSLEKSMYTIKGYINELSEKLSDISNKNLDNEIKRQYIGEFVTIKDSINTIITNMNSILREILNASSEVEQSSLNVATASQNLSKDLIQQSEAVHAILESVTNVAEQSRDNAVSASKANDLSIDARTFAEDGNNKMSDMLKSMEDIKASSTGIANIIKIIEDIAFQTNILALNAAVESARAGLHGKGFAVVAEEVRNLATRSSIAAKESSEMINNSLIKVEVGSKIANDTADSLIKIASVVTNINEILEKITDSSTKQSELLMNVEQSVTHISDITQTNALIVQETTSRSEIMSNQAKLLKSMVSEFNLKKK